jgi:hypothetical protein
MGPHDWYRNESWNATIEAAFAERLRRAKNKFQYLRIQASCLAGTHPDVALRLVDQYTARGEHFDLALAHVERARAYVALSDIGSALASYEAALSREESFPGCRTQAYLQLPCLIVTHRMIDLYSRAPDILEANRTRPLFPLDRYLWHGARALILHEQGGICEAKVAAEAALSAASEKTSGFRYHPTLGLVEQHDNDDLRPKLESIAARRVLTSAGLEF